MPGLNVTGDLYGARVNSDGTNNGFVYLGNAVKLSLHEPTDIKQRTSHGRDTYGQVLDSAVLKKPSEITIELDELNRDNLTSALLGDYTAISQTAGTVTNEAMVAMPGAWVQLAYSDLTDASVTVTNTAGTTTYIEGTDYQVNYRMGFIMALTGGTITSQEDLKVGYIKKATTGAIVSGGTQPTIKMALKLDGRNLTDGAPVIINIDRAVLTPSAPVDFLTGDFAKLQFKGFCELLAGKTTPYTIELRQ